MNAKYTYDLTIVIINYRTPTMTIDCIVSLLPELSNIISKVVIVDNDSGDDSINIIQNWIDQNNLSNEIVFIKSLENLGFSGGNNLGINAINSKYYLLLNSDTLMKKDSVDALIARINGDTTIGLVTPQLEGMDGVLQESCFNYMTPISEFISAARTGFIYKLFSRFIIPLPVTNDLSSPPWSSFACILIKKEVFDDIGLLDDGFFMYYEDTEFCYRARESGWDIINEPKSHVIHLGGKSSSFNDDLKNRKRQPHYFYESRTRYFYLIYGRMGLLTANLLWLSGRIVSKTIQLMGRTNKATPKKQWIDIWINFLNPLSNSKSR